MDVFNYHGLIGLIILLLDIWAIANVATSSNGVASKILWIVVILILPVVGFIFWLIFGPRSPRRA
jgi:succinate dehydrogenase/fumarate reductase cytochrome b subunit